MSAEITLLFLEKRVEASKLGASITEPFATGGEPCAPESLIADYMQVAGELQGALDDLKTLNDSLDGDSTLEEADKKHVHSRVGTTVGEVSRAAQDFSAQIRFFEAMNPNDADKAKPALDAFDAIEKGTRDFTIPDGPDEGAELAPEEGAELAPQADDDVDPMLM
ncbi:hypothetical protein OAU50_03240 [Planctomycetota bacterium]|nr:hypothetical protein [Planctomycetota bacterium]